MKLRYERELSHSYLVAETRENEEEDYRFRMLEVQKSKGLLRGSIRRCNGNAYIYYEVDGCKSIADRFTTKGMDSIQLRRMFLSLARACHEMGEYLLEEDCLVLSQNTVFINLRDNTYHFMCRPSDEKEDLERFSIELIDIIDHSDDLAMQIGYTFCEMVQDGGSSIYEMATMLSQMSEYIPDQEEAQNREMNGYDIPPMDNYSNLNENRFPEDSINHNEGFYANNYSKSSLKHSDYASELKENSASYNISNTYQEKRSETKQSSWENFYSNVEDESFFDKGKNTQKFTEQEKRNNAQLRKQKSGKSVSLPKPDKKKTYESDMKPSFYYICATISFLICLGALYVKMNYTLLLTENIIIMTMIAVTLTGALIILYCGYKAKQNKENPNKSLTSSSRNNQKKKGKTFDLKAATRNDNNPYVSENKNIRGKAFSVNDISENGNSPENTFNSNRRVITPEKNMDNGMIAQSPLRKGLVRNENMQGSTDYETTVLNRGSSFRSERLYSRGQSNCIQIALDKLPMTIGKMAGGVDTCLNNQTISRIHARIFRDEDNNVCVQDLNSTNGTFHNGLRLKPQQASVLVPGDEICFADMVFDFR